jgi:hypothetical protein
MNDEVLAYGHQMPNGAGGGQTGCGRPGFDRDSGARCAGSDAGQAIMGQGPSGFVGLCWALLDHKSFGVRACMGSGIFRFRQGYSATGASGVWAKKSESPYVVSYKSKRTVQLGDGLGNLSITEGSWSRLIPRCGTATNYGALARCEPHWQALHRFQPVSTDFNWFKPI